MFGVFSRVFFLVSSLSTILDIFPHPPTLTHLWPVWRAFPSSTYPPQTICLICFVFSNELDVIFNTNTHSYKRKKWAELFLFEFFDSQSRKLLKRVKVSRKKYFFFMIIEKEEDDEAVVVWGSKKHSQITQTQTYPSTYIRVLSKMMQRKMVLFLTRSSSKLK